MDVATMRIWQVGEIIVLMQRCMGKLLTNKSPNIFYCEFLVFKARGEKMKLVCETMLRTHTFNQRCPTFPSSWRATVDHTHILCRDCCRLSTYTMHIRNVTPALNNIRASGKERKSSVTCCGSCEQTDSLCHTQIFKPLFIDDV